MPRIDAHIHYVEAGADIAALQERWDLKFFNVCVAHEPGDGWRQQATRYAQLAHDHPERYAWCTTCDLPDFADPRWADRVVAALAQDFAAGAAACKFWKNLGMAERTPSGAFLMIDDPILDPVYEYLTWIGKPALMHIAEPLACWQPLDASNPHYGYYSQHPEWHMHNRPDFPSHPDLMTARDHVLEKHPRLRVIGAHLASLEYDVAVLAERLERYPNLAVDTSARLFDLMHQPSDAVRSFFIAYQDRVLFGTDIVHRRLVAQMSGEERAQHFQSVDAAYRVAFSYYESDAVLSHHGREVHGLGLPAEVLDKLYTENAREWYPGL